MPVPAHWVSSAGPWTYRGLWRRMLASACFRGGRRVVAVLYSVGLAEFDQVVLGSATRILCRLREVGGGSDGAACGYLGVVNLRIHGQPGHSPATRIERGRVRMAVW